MLTVLYPVLDALNDGRVIRRFVAGGLQLAGWLTLMAGVIGVVVILKAAFSEALPTEATIAGVMWAVIFAAAVAALAQISFYHARDVRRLRDDRFVLIPIASIVFRLVGEQVATWCVAFGIAGFLVMLVASPYARFLLNATGFLPLASLSGVGLLGALWVLATSLSTGFTILLLFYFSGEMVLVAADAANHLRHLVTLASASASAPQPSSVTTVADQPHACPVCRTPLAGGAQFCELCGTPL